MTSRASGRLLLWAVALTAACSQNPQPQTTPAAAADSAARARTDSLAAAARSRADSLAAAARADSLARMRADSIAAALRDARADSVRAQVLLDSINAAAPATPSGLASADEARLFAPTYFDYDRSDVRTDQVTAMEARLAVLRANPRLQIQIEGHADDRGPDEYNLALGNRRAATVKRWLVERGIADDRVTIISYGEERPAAGGGTEEVWALNRRAEFRVTRPAR